MRFLHEWGFGAVNENIPMAVYYNIFYGRGIMQLTWSGNYKDYGAYKRMPNHNGNYTDRLQPTNPRLTRQSTHYTLSPNDGGVLEVWAPKYDPDVIAENAFYACDSGGFYWVSKSFSEGSGINRVCDRPYNADNTGFVNRLVNGGSNGYYERQAYTAFMMRLLTESTRNTVNEIISPTRKNEILVDFSKAE